MALPFGDSLSVSAAWSLTGSSLRAVSVAPMKKPRTVAGLGCSLVAQGEVELSTQVCLDLALTVSEASLVVRPHPQHSNGFFLFENLIHQSMLYVDPA